MGKKAESKSTKKESKKDKKDSDRKDDKDEKRHEKNGKSSKWKKGKSNRSYDTKEEIELSRILAQSGLVIHHMDGDGNCMFRSIADQLTGDASNHLMFREKIMRYIEQHSDHFSLFMEDDEKFEVYVERMKECNEWGGHHELYAASQCFNINITVYQLDNPTYVIQAGDISKPTRDIMLSYHGDCHYNSVRVDSNRAGQCGIVAAATSSSTSTTITSNASYVFDDDLAVVHGAVPWIEKERVVSVLQQCKGDVDAAIELLCADAEAISLEETGAVKEATTNIIANNNDTSSKNCSEGATNAISAIESADVKIPSKVVNMTNIESIHPTHLAPAIEVDVPLVSTAIPQIEENTLEKVAKDKKYRKTGDSKDKPISKKEQRMKDREAAREAARKRNSDSSSVHTTAVTVVSNSGANTIIL